MGGEIKAWTDLHAFSPLPSPCSCCGLPILAVKKVSNTIVYACPRCDFIYRLEP